MSAPPSSDPVDTGDSTGDVLLMRGVAVRDRGAFAALFDRYAGRIKAFLMRRGTSADEAEELVQEVMVTVWGRAASYDPDRAAVSTWIFTIARNRRIDLARRAGRQSRDVLDPSWEREAEPDGYATLAAAQREGRLRDALADLPEAQRQVLVAAFYEGLSHAEIAARDGVPLGTVKSRLRLAFRRLAAELGEDFAESLGVE